MQVVFLGTAGSYPTAKRAAPAIAVRRRGELLLLDCGEGTQRQMAMAGIGLKTRMRILVTHMHGDHVLGIPGILQTMALFDRTAPLRVYGPKGIYDFIKAVKETVKFGLTYPIEVTEAEEGVVYGEGGYHVEARWMNHPAPALGYALVEKTRPGRFNPEKAEALRVPKGPLWGELQKGRTVKTPTGEAVRPEDVLGPPRRGRKIAYTGDTAQTDTIMELARGADLLVHEATFSDELEDEALESGHSTPSQAAEVAKRANVKRLVLTHISARYLGDEGFLDRARRIFPETVVAEDFMVVEVPLLD